MGVCGGSKEISYPFKEIIDYRKEIFSIKTKMRAFLIFLFLAGGFLLFAPGEVFAADRIWDGGGADNNFTTAENWVDDVAPVADDNVIFNAGNVDCVLDAFDLDQGDFTVTDGYSGTFTSSGTFKCDACTLDLTNATWNITHQFETGTTDHGALTITAGTFTTSGPLYISGDITLSGNATINQTGSWTVMQGTTTKTISNSGTGSITFHKFEENSDTSAVATACTRIHCDISVGAEGMYTNNWDQVGDGYLIIGDGTNPVVVTVAGGYYNKGKTETLANSTVRVAGDIEFNDSLCWGFDTSAGGTFEWTGTVDKHVWPNSNPAYAFYNFTLSGSAQLWHEVNDIYISNNLTISDGVWHMKKSIYVTGDITLSGDAILRPLGDDRPGQVRFGGTLSCADTSKVRTEWCGTGTDPDDYVEIIGAPGALRAFTAADTSMGLDQTWLEDGINEVRFNNVDVQFDLTQGPGAKLALTGDSTFDAITLDGDANTSFTTGAYTATIGGALTNTFGAVTISDGGEIDATGQNVSIGTNGTLTLAGASTLKAANITNAGTINLDHDSNIIDITGDIDNNNTIDATGTSANIYLEGNWDNNATFIASNSTITFDGTTSATFEAGSSSYNNIVINKTSGVDANDNLTFQTDSVTVNGALTITDGELIQQVALTTGTVTLSDTTSKWTNVTDNANLVLSGNVSNAGTITFDAPTDDLIQIRSSIDGTQRNWQGAGTFNMTDVDVKDQTCSGGNPSNITVVSGTDSGNNLNWIFESTEIDTPEAAKVTGQRPTIIGSVNPGDNVVIKGTVGGIMYQTVAQVTADANGNYIVTQSDYTQDLDVGANQIRVDVGGVQGDSLSLTVVASPDANQVPTITSHSDGDIVRGNKPAISGKGLAGENAVLKAFDKNGNLLLSDVATTVVDSTGTWSISSSSYTTSLPKGTNYLTVVIDGVASDVLSLELVDPFGVVFDSVTNKPIANATVTIYNSDGTRCTPGIEIAATDSNPQTTGQDGTYSFLCANGNYYIRVSAAGYTYPSRKTTFPTGRIIVNGSKGEVFTVAGAVIEMDQPLDPDTLLLKIKKEANKKEAVIGEVITYTITIKNIASTDVSEVFLEDRIPPGFKYIEGKATLDGVAINPTGTNALLFDIGTVNAGTTRTLKYQLVVGSGVTLGNYENTAWCRYSDETVISNKDYETVKIVLDPLFDLGMVIGKVFWDWDEDGKQDRPRAPEHQSTSAPAVENGIPDVQIVMEDGTVVTTDKDGKYHIPAVVPGRHILRLDERTLPEGAYLTTDKAVIVDITPGILAKINFGVNSDKDIGLRTSDIGQIRITQQRERPTPRLNVSLYPPSVFSYQSSAIGHQPSVVSQKTEETKEEKLKTESRELKADYEFRIFTNYSLFIDKWRVEILDKDTREVVKTFTGDRSGLSRPIYWDGKMDDGRRIREDRNYVYVLTVTGKDGRQDVTKERELKVTSHKSQVTSFEEKEKSDKEKEEEYREWIERESKINNLEKQNIRIEGETVLVQSPKPKVQSIRVMKNGNLEGEIPVVQGQALTAKELLEKPQFEKEQESPQEIDIIIPKGEYDIEVMGYTPQVNTLQTKSVEPEAMEGQAAYSKHIKVGEDYLFFVAMGDAKAGYTFHKGDIEPIAHDDKYREGFWSNGKLAYYLKGKIKGKYLITSSLDTDRDKKELFRNLDPDKYYPVYGDASSIDYKATDTQGMLYLLIEWDKSSILWGNYETGFSDTELAQFNRTLYGGRLHYESVSATPFGQPHTRLIVFGARAQQKAAHNEFTATAGSLYYLKHKHIIEGSEKVEIQIRDKVTGLVLARLEQEEGFDYDIDYDNGRLIFWQPVSCVVESDSITSTHIANGNPVYVVVDYEYEVIDKYDRGVYGGRINQSITDYVEVGGTYVKEEQVDKNYELIGTDTTLHLGRDTQVIAEYAESESEELNRFISTDGGLSFTELATADDTRGKAYGIKGISSLFDNKVGIETYFKRVERNFSSTSTAQEAGKELIGGRFTCDVTSKTRLSLRHDTQRLIDDGNEQARLQVGAKKTETTIAQITHRFNRLKLTGEYRHNEVEEKLDQYESETNPDDETVAIKADYRLSDKTTLSLRQQVTLDGEDNHQTTAGIRKKLNDYLSFGAEETVGSKGTATTIDATFNMDNQVKITGGFTRSNYTSDSKDEVFITTKADVDENSQVYHTYSISNSYKEGRRYASAYGAKKRLSSGIELNLERERSLSETENKNSNIFGLTGNINDRLAALLSFERGEVQNHDGAQYKRNAASLGIAYKDKDRIKASSKIEYRLDEGDEDKSQYLLYSAIEGKVNTDTTLFAKVSFSQSDAQSGDSVDGLYKEYVAGCAFRPVKFDKLNLLAKYAYLEDGSPSSQTDINNIEKEKAHIISTEGVYDLTDKWQLSQKLAFKIAEERVAGFGFTRTTTWLNVNRLNYNLNEDWQIAGEYRFLRQQEADDYKQGALVEVARNIGDFIQIGVGYNFTDFNDDLTHLDYTSYGPFIRVTGRFY